MGTGNTYRFDSRNTDYSTCFMINGDKVGYLADAVFPPVGTQVSLPDGQDVVVDQVRLDLSNDSSLAMVYVTCSAQPTKPSPAVPVRVR